VIGFTDDVLVSDMIPEVLENTQENIEDENEDTLSIMMER
jgi:uncharacterized membrane protein YkvA (DUF1232 family)